MKNKSVGKKTKSNENLEVLPRSPLNLIVDGTSNDCNHSVYYSTKF